MLLNEFLKEHRKVQEQEVTITQLKKDLRAQPLRSSLRDSTHYGSANPESERTA